jgi:hypothetical protein
MFAGVFGELLFLRLPEQRMMELISDGSGEPFEPVSGKPTSAYAQIADPPAALSDEALACAATLAENPKGRKGS